MENQQNIHANQSVNEFSASYGRGTANTRDSLKESARKLFSKHGFHAVSMRKLAASVGMHPGSIYASFASKQEILADIIEEFEDDLLMAVTGNVRAAGGRRELDAYVNSSIQFLIANSDSEILAQQDFRVLPSALREQIISTRRSRRALLMGVLVDAYRLQESDLELVADGVESLIAGAVKQYHTGSGTALEKLAAGVNRLTHSLLTLSGRKG